MPVARELAHETSSASRDICCQLMWRAVGFKTSIDTPTMRIYSHVTRKGVVNRFAEHSDQAERIFQHKEECVLIERV